MGFFWRAYQVEKERKRLGISEKQHSKEEYSIDKYKAEKLESLRNIPLVNNPDSIMGSNIYLTEGRIPKYKDNIEISDFLNLDSKKLKLKEKPIIILGDSGAGKSTAVKKLAYDVLKREGTKTPIFPDIRDSTFC